MVRLTELNKVGTYAAQARMATIKRDAAIRSARAHGASLRTIADAAGLSHTQIANILNKESK